MNKSHADILAANVSTHIGDALHFSSRFLSADNPVRVSIGQIAHFYGPMVVAFKEEIARRERVIESLKRDVRAADEAVKILSERGEE